MYSWKSMTHLVIVLCFLLKRELKHSCIHGTLAIIEGNATLRTSDFIAKHAQSGRLIDEPQLFFTLQLNRALLVGSSSLQSQICSLQNLLYISQTPLQHRLLQIIQQHSAAIVLHTRGLMQIACAQT